MKEFESLKSFGLSTNEIKVYTTLLKYDFLNGYEIAKNSGVARSLVYDVINRLENKKIIKKIDGNPVYYKAISYKELIENKKKDDENNYLKVEEELKTIVRNEDDDNHVLNILGFDKFLANARKMIENAKNEISLSIWNNEASILKNDLENAIEKGIKVYIFSFENIDIKGAIIYSYNISDAINLFPYRRTTLIIDNVECLIGENAGEKSISTYTKNHSILSLATDEIVLNTFWYKFIESRSLLKEINTSSDFKKILYSLSKELNITDNMTKNFLVYDYQKEK